ncbi:MAG: hypothetical protein ABR973_05775 [Candidatus Acidiferrales bacterium]
MHLHIIIVTIAGTATLTTSANEGTAVSTNGVYPINSLPSFLDSPQGHIMAHFGLTLWMYLRWSLGFLYAPPFVYVTLLLAINFAAAVISQRPLRNPIWKRTYPFTIAQFLFFPATLAVAVIGRVDWQQPHFPGPNYWGLRAEDVFAVSSVIVGSYWIWKMKGLRWFASSLALLQLWLLAAANFIAAMSLTGTWL